MMILRYGGYALLSGAGVLLGAEVLRGLETDSLHFLTLEDVWSHYSVEGLEQAGQWVKAGPFPGLWEDLVAGLLKLPLLGVMVMVSLILIYIGRHGHLES